MGDLKPENLLIHGAQRFGYLVKIVDFGLARKTEDRLHTFCGTPSYVAPEIIEGKPYHSPVDIWSLGVITYTLLCGYTPFPQSHNLHLMYKRIKEGEYSFSSKQWEKITGSAKRLVGRMLQVDPDD